MTPPKDDEAIDMDFAIEDDLSTNGEDLEDVDCGDDEDFDVAEFNEEDSL